MKIQEVITKPVPKIPKLESFTTRQPPKLQADPEYFMDRFSQCYTKKNFKLKKFVLDNGIST